MAIDRTAVPVEKVRNSLRGAAKAASDDGAQGFAIACRLGACAISELHVENIRLRRIVADLEAKLGLRQ
ncbi:MAG: hypothetical protein AAFY65_10915 [Pseudomonadota bacterium]